MNFIIGFLVAVVGFIAASAELKQGISNYWDFVAFSVVIGGTISVLISTRPKIALKVLMPKLFIYLFGAQKNKFDFTKKCFETLSTKSASHHNQKNIEGKLVADGLEMIELGFTKEKIESILIDRYFYYKKTIKSISAWIKRCAKYPPAFGLGGTVLGLIHLMKGISAGADPKESGVRMAVALVATFYGILLSNLVLNPSSEAITEKLKSDEELAEIAIKTIIMLKEDFNLLESQEVLNSYLVDSNSKINFMSQGDDSFSESSETQAA